MIRLYRIYGTKFLLATMWLVTILWAGLASFSAYSNANRILVVEVTDIETSVVNSEENTPIEIENFLNNFVGLFYSYTGKNYENHIDRAVEMLDPGVLLPISEKLNKRFDKIVGTTLSQTSMIYEIQKIGRLKYEMTIEMNRREAIGGEIAGKFIVKVTLAKVPRSGKLPYGLKIIRLEERDV